MNVVGLNAVVEYEGAVYRVVAIGDGRTITMRALERPPCPTCERTFDVSLLEHSPLFQERVKPVATVGDFFAAVVAGSDTEERER